MNRSNQNLDLSEAASHFLASLPLEEREANHLAVYGFVHWYGWGRPFAELTALGVANYAEQLSLSNTDYIKKLGLIRTFLIYAKKEGWSNTNLAVHLKTKKSKARMQPSVRQVLPGTISLTQQGYAELETELADLRSKRPQLIEEMRRAAADKDFSENAPLDAAKEQRGYLEGRIKELEEVLKLATVISKKQEKTLKVSIGNSIVLCDLASGEELCYMIVEPREVNPAAGKVSGVSPIGKAVLGRGEGEVVEVTAPVGKLRYRIKQIER